MVSFLFFLPFFRVSQYLSKPRDREFLCLILWGSVHVYVREMRRRDWKGEEGGWVFSWKYRNGRSQVLPWVMSLMKESEHLASHRLSVRTRQRDGSGWRVRSERSANRYKFTSGGSACCPKHAQRSTLMLKVKDVDHSGVTCTPKMGLKMHQIGHLTLTLQTIANIVCNAVFVDIY